MSEFRSEISVPVNKDQLSFDERQRQIMSDIERDMEERRRQWESEVERTRREFFKTPTFLDAHVDNSILRNTMRPFPTGAVQDEAQTWYEDGPNGQPLWKARFSLNDFSLEDIKVIVNPDRTLVVQAKAERRDGGAVVAKEFSRQLALPRDVVIEQMGSLLSSDGVLTIQAPVSSPEYVQPTLPASVPRPMVAPASSFHTSRFESSSPSRIQNASPRLMQAASSSQSNLSSSPRIGGNIIASAVPQGIIGSNMFAAPTRGIVAINANGEQVMQWSFNLESNIYTAEEISVKVKNGNKLSVCAVHEERSGGRTSRHEFTRECDLPESVDVRSLVTFYRPEQGVLNVEAKLLPEFQTAVDQRNRGQRLPVAFE